MFVKGSPDQSQKCTGGQIRGGSGQKFAFQRLSCNLPDQYEICFRPKPSEIYVDGKGGGGGAGVRRRRKMTFSNVTYFLLFSRTVLIRVVFLLHILLNFYFF
jgi:hypothetical protein